MHIKAGVAAALKWGAGGFALDGGSALTLEGLEISGPIVAAPGASLELKGVTFAPGGCVGGQATLVDTPTPELCLFNVIVDTDNIASLVAAVAGGLPGAFVLRLAGAGPFEVPALDIHADQDVHIICTGVGSLVLLAASGKSVTVAGDAALVISGQVGSVDVQGVITLAASAAMTFTGEVALTTGGLVRALSFGGEGSVAFEGEAITVLSLDGQPAGSVAGGLPGTATVDLTAHLAPGGATGRV